MVDETYVRCRDVLVSSTSKIGSKHEKEKEIRVIFITKENCYRLDLNHGLKKLAFIGNQLGKMMCKDLEV